MFAVELRHRNIAWVFECDAVPMVNLDTHLFELVMINVIKNAYEAIGRDGLLTVSLKQGNERLELSIRDSAGLLSQVDRQKLFKPFYTTKRSGQGIGLMLVREILNQHGFAYSLECEPGAWTCFRILL